MGFVSKRTSDISGQISDDDQVITVVVRALDKKFDATGEELAGLKRPPMSSRSSCNTPMAARKRSSSTRASSTKS